MNEVLDWAAKKTLEIFGAILKALKTIGEKIEVVLEWAKKAAMTVWGWIGEVIVRAGVTVEAQPARMGALGQAPLGGEHPQISIDGREAHARQAAPDPPVHERRGRMGVGRADHVEDDAPGPCQPESAVAQRVDRLVRNHYQLRLEAKRTHLRRRVSRVGHLARSLDFQ